MLIVSQFANLCPIHDHITRVIAAFDIPTDRFADSDHPEKARYDLAPIIRLFLYQHVRGFTQNQLATRLHGVAYVSIRLGLAGSLGQQAISYTWRQRFSLGERRAITQAATAIQKVCTDHDLSNDGEPRTHPDTIDNARISDDRIIDAIERARNRDLAEFDIKRAANATYDDVLFFERQAYLALTDAGTTTRSKTATQRFARASGYDDVPVGDTHLRTMKQTATPAEQLRLDEFEDGHRPPDWKRIRDEVLEVSGVPVNACAFERMSQL